MKLIAFIFHLSCWIYCIYSLNAYDEFIHDLVKPNIKDYWIYWSCLSYITLHIQFIYFTLSLMSHAPFLTSRFRDDFNEIKTVFFASVVVPSCFSVIFHFWILNALGVGNEKSEVECDVTFSANFENGYDPLSEKADASTIHDSPTFVSCDSVVELWRQLLYTVAIPLAPLDVLFVQHNFPTHETRKCLTVSCAATYIIWLHLIHTLTDTWIYSIMDTNKFGGSLWFFVCEVYLSTVFYTIGEFLNSAVYRITSPSEDSLSNNNRLNSDVPHLSQQLEKSLSSNDPLKSTDSPRSTTMGEESPSNNAPLNSDVPRLSQHLEKSLSSNDPLKSTDSPRSTTMGEESPSNNAPLNSDVPRLSQQLEKSSNNDPLKSSDSPRSTTMGEESPFNNAPLNYTDSPRSATTGEESPSNNAPLQSADSPRSTTKAEESPSTNAPLNSS